jgi:hypothetical protein
MDNRITKTEPAARITAIHSDTPLREKSTVEGSPSLLDAWDQLSGKSDCA